VRTKTWKWPASRGRIPEKQRNIKGPTPVSPGMRRNQPGSGPEIRILDT
jgi:hypothetical protein